MKPSYPPWLVLLILAGQGASALGQGAAPMPIRIALIGDSTVASYPNPPKDRPDLTGWGQVLGELFQEHVQVANHAASGRSSKSFLREGRWPKVLEGRPDYVFIQFGHNDQPGKGDRATDAEGDFQDNLKRYIGDSRQIGAKPILVTPVARRTFEEGQLRSTLGPYADAMKKVGHETQTPVIDLHAASFKLIGELGDEPSAWISAAANDRSHFSRKGALAIARLVADALPAAVPELATQLRKPPDASSRQTGLSKELLDLALEPPALNTNPGPEYDDHVRVGNMVIGIAQTPQGRLWACWVGNGDSPNGFFMLATSDDGGRTWSKPRLVIDPTDPPNAPQRRALVGNLWTDPRGRLWCFFDQSLGYFDGRCGDWHTRCDDPDAADPQWTRPVRFADGCTLNKPTVLANGDWLLPVSLWTRDRIRPAMLKDAHRDLDAVRMANVFVSTDEGRTWTRRGGVAFPDTDFDEHMIVELKDSRLWMLARTKSGISDSFSSDQGRAWTAPRTSAIQNVSARFFIRRLQSGNLLLVKNGPLDVRLPRRSSLTAFLSADDGQTWSNGLLLDDRAQVSYPDGIQTRDGTIHILYDWNRHTDAEILLAKFREEDVRAGSFDSPGAKQRMLVNKALSPRLPKAVVPSSE